MPKLRLHTQKRGTGTVFIVSVIASLLLLVASSFIMALIANSSENPTSMVGIFALASLLASAAVSGFATSRIKGEGGFRVAALSALAVALIMLIIGIITNGGRLGAECLMNYACYLGVAMLFGYFGKKRERRPRRMK